jgi:uncharacterized protein (TIGR02246 family)
MTTDLAGIHESLDRIKDAWDRGDPDAYASCFTPGASYVTFVGTIYLGRTDIADSHRALFEKFAKGTRMHMTVLDVQFYGTDTVTVVTCGDAAKKPPRHERAKVQSFTFCRTDQGWLCAAFQNTKSRPLMERVAALFDRRFIPLRDRAA